MELKKLNNTLTLLMEQNIEERKFKALPREMQIIKIKDDLKERAPTDDYEIICRIVKDTLYEYNFKYNTNIECREVFDFR